MKPFIRLALVLCAVLALADCGLLVALTVTGSTDTAVIENNELSFTRLFVANACRATVRYGASCSVIVTINRNFSEYVETEVSAGGLNVRLAPGRTYRNLVFEAVITLPALESLAADDAAQAAVSGFTSSAAMAFIAQDAATVDFALIDAPTLSVKADNASRIAGSSRSDALLVNVSDASQAVLSGDTDALTLAAADSSAADLAALETVTASALVNNASRAQVNVTGSLSGSVNNASLLRYTGNPLSVDVRTGNVSELVRF